MIFFFGIIAFEVIQKEVINQGIVQNTLKWNGGYTVNIENLVDIKSRPPRPGLILDHFKSRPPGFPGS